MDPQNFKFIIQVNIVGGKAQVMLGTFIAISHYFSPYALFTYYYYYKNVESQK